MGAAVHSRAAIRVDVRRGSRSDPRMRRFEVTADDEQLLARYLAHAAAVDGYAATTIVQRRTALRSFLAWLRADGGNLDGVDVEVLHRYLIAEHQAGSAARTRQVAITALRHFFAWHRPGGPNPATRDHAQPARRGGRQADRWTAPWHTTTT